ncbi:MAG TPA: methylmalonyl Co-A mutase-associated GTPase MeaB, partial [Oligoflexia bacterium]|nr:methylmalonyl Co-A mutase-associated GTPase MeaB [Oligoflexia bacterium]
MQIVKKMLAGDRLALARVISVLENRGDALEKLVKNLYPKTGNAFVLGITGPPGAGKSTVTDRLIARFRAAKLKTAVIAIDPSSPFSGGAILGDRIRMQSHTGDKGVFIRSLGTRGRHGGLSLSSREVVMALDAAGFDVIIVETAGVGQTELDILKLAHGVCVVLVPESGDGIQVMKAGLMEIADIFVVNKCDRPESDKLVRELTNMLHMFQKGTDWEIPVIKTQATQNQGIEELFQSVLSYQKHLKNTDKVDKKRLEFLREELIEIVRNAYGHKMNEALDTKKGQKALTDLFLKKKSP